MSSARRILLADADAFYVAVARLADPEGAGKARFLIVGGSPEQRGVVTSASYEARAFGVHSAMPMVQAVRLCPEATVVPVPWEACAQKSRDIGAALRRFTPVVEQASSDEFYLDLSGTEELYDREPLAATARRMRDTVIGATSLSLSIGGGTSKFVAKLAAGLAKPRPGGAADGVHIVAPGAETDFMLQFALADIPLIGPKFRQRLARFGLRTVRDVVQSDRAVYAVARELLTRLRAARRVPARLLGVALSQLVRTGGEGQLSLLDSPGSTLETERDRVISRMIDEVREKFGPDALGRGGAR